MSSSVHRPSSSPNHPHPCRRQVPPAMSPVTMPPGWRHTRPTNGAHCVVSRCVALPHPHHDSAWSGWGPFVPVLLIEHLLPEKLDSFDGVSGREVLLELPCLLQIISEVYLLSHLRGRRHQEALLALHDPALPVDSTHMIVEAAKEHQGALRDHPEAQERLKAGKKRAKKLRHRMAGRWVGLASRCGSQSLPWACPQGT